MSAELRQLVASFGKMPLDLRRDLRAEIKDVAQPVMDEAQRRASWSGRIPGAMRISVKYGRKTAGVSLRVSAKKAPHARPYEHGGAPGKFRHPVYKRRGRPAPWVDQQARPFLAPAARAKAPEVAGKIAVIVDRVAKENGFH